MIPVTLLLFHRCVLPYMKLAKATRAILHRLLALPIFDNFRDAIGFVSPAFRPSHVHLKMQVASSYSYHDAIPRRLRLLFDDEKGVVKALNETNCVGDDFRGLAVGSGVVERFVEAG
ncbi:hypothetical protein Tco_0620112 [Tanacetum coccineum]